MRCDAVYFVRVALERASECVQACQTEAGAEDDVDRRGRRERVVGRDVSREDDRSDETRDEETRNEQMRRGNPES